MMLEGSLYAGVGRILKFLGWGYAVTCSVYIFLVVLLGGAFGLLLGRSLSTFVMSSLARRLSGRSCLEQCVDCRLPTVAVLATSLIGGGHQVCSSGHVPVR